MTGSIEQLDKLGEYLPPRIYGDEGKRAMKKVLTYPGLNGFGAKRGERPLCARQQEKRPGAVRIRVMAAALILGCMSIGSAAARECAAVEAGNMAEAIYGGEAISVRPDGDYLIVRLRLPDRRVIDVAIDRWSC